HDDSFPLHRFLDQIEFHAHVEVANQLTRLQKGAPDVVIAHERVLVGNVQLMREPKRRVIPGVGHWDHNVSVDWKLSGQLAPHFRPDLGHIDSANDAVRPGEIDILEHAKGRLLFLEWEFRTYPILADDQDFAGRDFANEFGVNQIESGSFG